MNNDIIEGNWKQMTGSVQKQWGKLTNNQLDQVGGSRKKLAGIIQEQYGVRQDNAEKQIEAWEDAQKKITMKK
jgi:uncharacterized protein YjbJ (UPF0337 family)